MNNSPVHLIGLGFVLTTAPYIWAQAPSANQAPTRLADNAVETSLREPLVSPANKPHNDSFVIGNDDLLAINVWKEPDLSRAITVRLDGKISLPLAGELQAAGRTPLQLEQEIAIKLRNFIAEPEVTVMVQQTNSEKFNILGQVVRPGSYSLTAATTVLDAIAEAGGFRDFAKQKGVYVLRQSPDGVESRIAFNYKEVIKGKSPEQNVKLEPRDTIVVP